MNPEVWKKLKESGRRMALTILLVTSGCSQPISVLPTETVVLPTPGRTPKGGEFKLMSGTSVTLLNQVDGRRLEVNNNGPEGLLIRDLDKNIDYLSPLEAYLGCNDCQVRISEGVEVPDWQDRIKITTMERGKGRAIHILSLWPWTRK